MVSPFANYYEALNHVRTATRAGDCARAERWTRIAERHLNLIERRARLAEMERRATSPSAGRKLPVMVDPKGFSPGGTPNNWINFARLERAGLDTTLADKLWKEQQERG